MWIIALRGDVYHAECHNSKCLQHKSAVPIYEAIEKNQSDKQTPSSVNNILICPDCKTRRRLTISFPGLEVKEREIRYTFDSLWESLGCRLSLICTVGFSGNWDREIVNYLASIAHKLDAPWFNVSIARPECIDPQQPESLVRSSTSTPQTAVHIIGTKFRGRYFEIKTSKGSTILAQLPRVPKDITHQETGLHSEDYAYLPSDHLWIHEGEEDQTFRLPSPQGIEHENIPRLRIRRHLPSALKRIVSGSNNDETALAADLKASSQLALKDFWWKLKSESGKSLTLHSRFNHSLGSTRVALAWFEGLRQSQSRQLLPHLLSADPNEIGELLSASMFLHDAGHIPFSHLIEEVFSELHWSFGTREKYQHEILTLSKLRNVENLVGGPLGNRSLDECWKLVQGRFGVTWLDAIVNSPLDADKIDYVFRDEQWLKIAGRLGDPISWLTSFLSQQRISPQGQIMLDGRSAQAAYQILIERIYLYDTFYFAPRIRVMERLVRKCLADYLTLSVNKLLGGIISERLSQNPDQMCQLNKAFAKDVARLLDHELNKQVADQIGITGKQFAGKYVEAILDAVDPDAIHDLGPLKLALSIWIVNRFSGGDFFPKLRLHW